MLDGAIYMSDISRREAYKVYPTLKHIPNTIIPHGHYRPILRNSCSRDEARARLGLPRQKTLFLCFGHIRRYKNIPLLIREFRALARDDFHLVVVGGPSSDDALTREIQHLAQDRPDITLVLEFVSDDVLANYLAACDYVVTPFDRILNSGSVLMALSAGRPVISPRMGSLADVEQSVGPGWVRAYQGPFEGRLLEEAAATPPPPAGPNLDSYDWDVLAHKTVAFYERVVAGER